MVAKKTSRRKTTRVSFWRKNLNTKFIVSLLLIALFAGIGTYVLNPAHADSFINTVYGPSDSIMTFTVNGPNTASDGDGYYITLNTHTSRFPWGDCTSNGGGQIAIRNDRVTTCTSPIFGRGGAEQYSAQQEAFFQFQKLHVGSLMTGPVTATSSGTSGVINRIPDGYYFAGWTVKSNTTDGHLDCSLGSGCGVGYSTGRLDLVLNILKRSDYTYATTPEYRPVFDNSQTYPTLGPIYNNGIQTDTATTQSGVKVSTPAPAKGTAGTTGGQNSLSSNPSSNSSSTSSGEALSNSADAPGTTNAVVGQDTGSDGTTLDAVDSASVHAKAEQHRRNLSLSVGLTVVALGLAATIVMELIRKRA